MIALSTLSGCIYEEKTQLSDEKILKTCLEERKKAMGPDGSVTISKSKDKTKVGIALSFSSNYLIRANPDEVFNTCLARLEVVK